MKDENIRLLLAQNSIKDYKFTKRLLKQARQISFTIKHVKKMSDVLFYLQKNKVDVVLLDLNLQDSQGFETFQKLFKTVGNNIPIILLVSTVLQGKKAFETVNVNPHDYLVKRFLTSYSLIFAISFVRARKKLEQQKEEFVASASHELKTPLTSIKAYSQVLHARFVKKGDLQSANLLLKMESKIRNLMNLINDLVDVAKIEEGKLRLNNGFFDFNNLVVEIVEEIQQTTYAHKLIQKALKTKEIWGDRERTGQAITNLISNAIKYSPNTGKIILTTKNENGNIVFCVEDFGIGVPKKMKDKIFERFSRIDRYPIGTLPGIGLGLFISSEIIKRQGGRIWLEEKSKKGSKFCFALPIKPNKI